MSDQPDGNRLLKRFPRFLRVILLVASSVLVLDNLSMFSQFTDAALGEQLATIVGKKTP